MEEAKRARGKYCKDQKEAILLIRKKGELTSLGDRKFTIPEIKIMCKWKKAKPKSARKEDLIEAYLADPKPKIQKIWTRCEEAALVALKNENVSLRETALGSSANQMARAVSNHVAKLDETARAELMESLRKYDQDNAEPSSA